MSGARLVVADLCVRQRAEPGAPLVRDVALTLEPGACLTLIGETGSGKTLVAQALLGILPPELEAGGVLAIDGQAPVALADRARLAGLWAGTLFLLPQQPDAALDPTMRIGAQVAEVVPAGAERVGATGRAFAAVDLPLAAARLFPAALSGGMSQRALVAMAGIAPAATIVADEPTKGLDDARVDLALSLLASLLAKGKSLLIVTHDLAVPRRLGGTVAVMCEGTIVEQQPARDFLAHPRHPYSRAYVDALPERWPRAAPHAAPVVPPTAAPAATVVRAERVTLADYHDARRTLFADLSFAIGVGTIAGLVGPSGAGKTSLGDILLGLRRPTAGGVRWGALDPYARPTAEARSARSRYQKIYQEPGSAFAPHRTLRKAFRDLLRLRPDLRLEARLPALLDRLRLKPGLLDRLPHEVSGGEAQRLAIARVLLLDPLFVVADEPTSGLDPIVQAETIQLLCAVARDARVAILLISHNRALVDAVCDQVLQLGSGSA